MMFGDNSQRKTEVKMDQRREPMPIPNLDGVIIEVNKFFQ